MKHILFALAAACCLCGQSFAQNGIVPQAADTPHIYGKRNKAAEFPGGRSA